MIYRFHALHFKGDFKGLRIDFYGKLFLEASDEVMFMELFFKGNKVAKIFSKQRRDRYMEGVDDTVLVNGNQVNN